MDRQPIDLQAMAVRAVFEKDKPLSEADLDTLRKNNAAASHLSGKADWFVFRMEIELIHSILKLNQSSTRLARLAITLTATGVVLALVQIAVAVMDARH